MPQIMPQARRDDLLKRVEKASPAKAKLDLNFVEMSARLFSMAIAKTGMTDKEAMDALGIEDKGQFYRMKEGKEKLWVHRLLQKRAVPILRELLIIAARESDCTVERIVRIVESA